MSKADLTKQILEIFSRKIEKELKEKACGCNGCTCESGLYKTPDKLVVDAMVKGLN